MNDDRLHAQIIARAADAIVFADRGGTIRLWNAGAERMFGFSADEAIGASLDLIIPEKQRQRHWQGYFQTMKTGQTRYGDKLLNVPALHRSGERISVEFSVVLVPGEEGEPAGVAAILRDVTERHREERELRRRLLTLEASAGA